MYLILLVSIWFLTTVLVYTNALGLQPGKCFGKLLSELLNITRLKLSIFNLMLLRTLKRMLMEIKMKNVILSIAWIIITVGVLLILGLLWVSYLNGYRTGGKINFTITGQFGDYIGGIVGTLFALSGTLLIYLNFKEQVNENKKSGFEGSFFEMIRLHKENLNELSYSKHKKKKKERYYNRQVIRKIYEEFTECYRETKKFSNEKNVDYYLNKKYKTYLEKIKLEKNLNFNLIEISLIDIAYLVTFYGLGVEGEAVIRDKLKRRYSIQYYTKVLYFLKMKPKRSNIKRFELWKEVRGMELTKLHPLINELYAVRQNPVNKSNLSVYAVDLKMETKYEKYYGGHQFRLGHYFRHLYQSYKYLDNSEILSSSEAYSYGKLFRAQLSTFEQTLLFINSLSHLGMKWELKPEINKKGENMNLITKYNLIKNVPGSHTYGITYKKYYPDINYEYEENKY